MAGYHGYSMSNNALDAYDSGEMPRSKWTKSAIMEALKSSGEYSADVIAAAAKAPAEALRNVCLTLSSWHHTSSYYNRTDFYSIDTPDHITVERIQSAAEAFKSSKANKPSAPEQPVYRMVEYIVWTGTRKHPKATRVQERCVIVGNWAMTEHNGKKSITANGFRFLD